MICKKLIIPMKINKKLYTNIYIYPEKDIYYLKHEVILDLSYSISIKHKSPMFPYVRPIKTAHITYCFYKNIT